MKKVELAQFLENIVKLDPNKPDLERYANSISCAYTKEEIKKLIDLFERVPACNTIKDSIANAKTYRVLFMMEKVYGKGSVESLINYLREKVADPEPKKDFKNIKIDVK